MAADAPLSPEAARIYTDLRNDERSRNAWREPGLERDPEVAAQRNMDRAVDDAIAGRGTAPPIHEVLLDEESPASELVRAHLEAMSDEDLAASWYQLEIQSRQLAEDPESSDWVKAGWDAEHAATMIGCSVRATDREMARREALKIPQSGAVGRDSP